MAPAIVNVLYPAKAADDFNMDYYLNKHMPLVQKNWAPHGLESWTVGVLDKEASGYHVQAVLVFKEAEGFQLAISQDKEVVPDVSNFTSAEPKFWIGGVAGQWKL